MRSVRYFTVGKDEWFPWDVTTCAGAALGGSLQILRWARENGCPWDTDTCKDAAAAGYNGQEIMVAHGMKQLAMLLPKRVMVISCSGYWRTGALSLLGCCRPLRTLVVTHRLSNLFGTFANNGRGPGIRFVATSGTSLQAPER